MRRLSAILIAALACISLGAKSRSVEPGEFQIGIRPPATPLFTVDPYFSIWSETDVLTDDFTRHWTGWKQPVLGAVRVDGKVYRVIGSETPDPKAVEGNSAAKNRLDKADEWYWKTGSTAFPDAAKQVNLNVLPTRTIYTFRAGGVEVDLNFVAPLIIEDLELVSRPVNYLDWDVRSADGRKHKVELYLEVSPRIAMDMTMVPMKLEKGSADGVDFVRTGTVDQKILAKRGDDVRIDWGWFYLTSREGNHAVVNSWQARQSFVDSGVIPESQGSVTTDNFVADDLALAYCMDLGTVTRKQPASSHVQLAYDDIWSILYLKKRMRPYWNRDGNNTITKEIAAAQAEHDSILERCKSFDKKITDETLAAGGKEYADLCALAYRQVMAAHKLVQSDKGDLFFFSKENFSNGCIGTVDVTYPSIPMMLLYNNDIAKATINMIFDYCEGPNWKKQWAAHDVGVYPDAYGQHYGDHMPLEECGNMLLLTAAVCLMDGNADYALKHWDALTTWALYAVEHGQMPENQLCTDDFAGKLAHNVNLSAKSILGIAAYARMAEMLGKDAEARAFRSKAIAMAAIWRKTAADGDHYRLAFDSEGTWSQKYNLVWDRLLGLNVFDSDIVPTEIAWYRSHQNVYGLPLDSRKQYTKTDWILWTATMASDSETFKEFVSPVWKFYNETTCRFPLGDWVNTDAPTNNAMICRSVVGGFYMKTLKDRILSTGASLQRSSCFEYSEAAVSPKLTEDGNVSIAVSVTNAGKEEKSEIVYLYLVPEGSSMDNPVQEPRDYMMINLKPGESRELKFQLTKANLSRFNTQTKRWDVLYGGYRAYLGPNSNDIRTSVSFEFRNPEQQPAAEAKSISILGIGNSFSVDAMEYLYPMLREAGYTDVFLGNLYIGGCSLERHINNIKDSKADYVYYTNCNGKWEAKKGSTSMEALKSRKWDYISMQQVSGWSGRPDSYEPFLSELVAEVKKVCPDAKLMWHMTWAYQNGSNHGDFPKYDRDQMKMYDAIVSAVKTMIIPRGDFSFVIPSGTAVQNLRSGVLGDNTTRDGFHMSYDLGRYITAMMWAKQISGCDLSLIKATPEGRYYTDTQISEIKKAVDAAYANPFTVTKQ